MLEEVWNPHNDFVHLSHNYYSEADCTDVALRIRPGQEKKSILAIYSCTSTVSRFADLQRRGVKPKSGRLKV